MIVSRYLSPRTRETLVELGASYADATGNMRLTVDRPAVFVEAAGADSDPWRGPEREMQTLKGRPAAKVVRALVDFQPPMGIRDLSQRSGASLGSTYRVVDFLDKEALLQRDDRGAIVDVNWPDLLMRWSQDYSFQKMNSAISGFEPRGPARVIDRLRDENLQYAVTGSLSAVRVAEVAAPQLATIFADEPEALVESLGLRASGPMNVTIGRAFDPVVYERSEDNEGVVYAAWSQTAVDLLSGPGRSPAEGEALVDWMRRNKGAWRR